MRNDRMEELVLKVQLNEPLGKLTREEQDFVDDIRESKEIHSELGWVTEIPSGLLSIDDLDDPGNPNAGTGPNDPKV